MSQKSYSLSIAKENKYKGFNACIIFPPSLENRITQDWGILFEIEWIQGERITNDKGEIEIWFNCSEEKQREVMKIAHFRQFYGGIGPSVN
jgi:hypothetical protein